MTRETSITISFTQEEVSWLAWVMRDVLATHQCTPDGEKACDKILKADELVNDINKVINERAKVWEVDTRKRPAAGARRKSSRGRSRNA